MLDQAINSALDSASPLITRWRVLFCILTLIFTSPIYSTLLDPPIYHQNIQFFITTLSEVIILNKIWVATSLLIIYFIVVPYAHFIIIKFLSTKNVTYAAPLIEEVIKIMALAGATLETYCEILPDYWRSYLD